MCDYFVDVELGASETRVCSNSSKVFLLPNNHKFVDAGAVIDVAVKDGTTPHEMVGNALDVTINKVSGEKNPHFPCRVILGDMAYRAFAECDRPSMLRNKIDQRINFVSALIGAAHQQLIGEATDEIDLYVALPPMEVAASKNEMEKLLLGAYSVKFNRLNKEVSVIIRTVTCLEESLMGLVSFFFTKTGALTEMGKKYLKGHVLGIDIGASTTDLAAAKDGRYIEKSGQTFKIGCNVIKAAIANAIRQRYGYDATDEELIEVVTTGRLSVGNHYDDMSVALDNAKRELAASILAQIQSYFRLVNIPLQMIRAIVVFGGGAEESKYTDENGKEIVTSPAITKFITDELDKIIQGVDVIPYPGESRLANINGMYVRSMLEIAMRKAREKQAVAVQVEPVATQQ